MPRCANWQSGLARAPPRSGGRRRLRVRLRPWARPGRQRADHLGLEPGMLWVRVPPGPLRIHCPRGAAWSARLPVTQEIAGSNPVEGAFDSSGAVRKPAKRPSSNLGDLRVRLPPAPLRATRDDWALASPTGRNPAIPRGFAGSTPARRTQARLVRLSVQDAGPSSRKGGFDSRTGRSSNMTMWWNWQTRDGQNVVPIAALGVRVSPWSLRNCRRGRCPTGSHKAGSPGSIPGPATAGGRRLN